MQIRYEVGPTDPADRWGRFSIELGDVDAPHLDLVLPSWVPGSYHLLPYPRSVRELRAVRLPDGSPLPVERIDKGRWRIGSVGARSVRVDYAVYGHELVTEGHDRTPEHLFLNPALCLPYVDGQRETPVELQLHVPADWRIVTELAEQGPGTGRFRAASYDELVDCPVDAGRPVVLTVYPRGIPHRIVLCGEGGNYEAHRLEDDIAKIADATIGIVGESPLARYTFFYHLTDKPDGGLEHATSCACVVNRNVFRPEEDYRRFLDLTSHEYVHLYNVKRIVPKAIVPFDYTREMYTRLLWWMEGTTDYYGALVLRRAGLLTPVQYLEEVARLLKQYRELPGRRRQSLEESSFLAWIDYYQWYEETPNQSISYYVKGHLVSMCLDLEIRERTENRASLDSVLRTLWQEYGKVHRGVGEDELLPIANRATGLDLGEFFDRYVRGTAEIDFDAFARKAGLGVGPKAKPKDDDGEEPGYLGAQVENDDGLVRLAVVLADGPAYRAGLAPGDVLVAFNGSRLKFDGFEKRLGKYPPGTPVDATVFRRGYLHRVALTTSKPPAAKWAFRPVEAPTDLARKVYEGWLGAPWEPAPAERPAASSTGSGTALRP